jgi:hypothetical protein
MMSSRGMNRPKTRPAQRPRWLTVLLILVAMLVLFGIGFGIATLLKGSGGTDGADASASPSSSTSNPGCTTIMVTPAEILPRASRVNVNVYNSTQRVGLAGDVAKILGVRGFNIVQVENDPLGVVIEGEGEIRYGPKGEANAELMAYHFPGGKRIDVVLGTKFVDLANDAEVVAQLARPSPSASPAGCPIPDVLPSESVSESAGVSESPSQG